MDPKENKPCQSSNKRPCPLKKKLSIYLWQDSNRKAQYWAACDQPSHTGIDWSPRLQSFPFMHGRNVLMCYIKYNTSLIALMTNRMILEKTSSAIERVWNP